MPENTAFPSMSMCYWLSFKIQKVAVQQKDVMQSSESLGLPPNSLNTESSIKQGCKYFASLLCSCKNQGIRRFECSDAVYAYNYGGGYVGYVAGKGKKAHF